MAQNEIVNVLTVKTENSEKTIKQLKDEVARLKKELENATIGSEKFQQATGELSAVQKELNSILKATKNSTTAADGSYDALVATMTKLKQEWRATADEAKRGEIGKQINDINTQLKELDSSIGNNQRKVGDYTGGVIDAYQQLKQEIKQYRSELLQLDEDSEEYTQTLAKLGDAQFRLRDINEKANLSVSDTGEILANTTKFASGIVAGFSAMQGAIALVGGESENLEKIMVKLQAGMALVQGLQGVEGLIDGYAGLKTALKGATIGVRAFIGGLSGVQRALVATGIGAFVVAIGTLAANWDKVTEAVSKFITKTNDAAVSIDRLDSKQKQLQGIAAKNNSELERELKILQAQGATEEELATKRLEIAKSNYTAQSEFVKNLQKEYNEAEFWNKEGNSNWTDEKLADLKSKLDKAKELEISYKDTVEDIQVDLKVAQIKSDNEQQKQHEKAIADKLQADKKAAEDAAKIKADELKEIQEEELKKIQETEEKIKQTSLGEVDKKIAELDKQLQEEKALYEKHGKDTTELVRYYEQAKSDVKKEFEEDVKNRIESEFNTWKTALLNSINEISDTTATTSSTDGYETGNVTPEEAYNNAVANYNAELDAEKAVYEQRKIFIQQQLDDETLTAQQEMVLQQALADNEMALQNAVLANYNKNVKAEELLDKRKLEIKKATLNSTSQLLSAMSDLVGENTAAGKAMAISSALINTYQSATGAYNSAVNPPAFGPASPAVGALFAAAAVAQGLAQVKQIMSVNPGGQNSMGASVSTATPSINLADSMPVQYTRELMTYTEMTELNKEQKVYVVESDITETQKKVDVTETNSSF